MANWTRMGIHLVVVMATFMVFVKSHGDEHIMADECGVTMGCFQHPGTCTGENDCELYTSWKLDENQNNIFVVAGQAIGYVALGFSKSGQMADSDIYACTKNNEVVRSRNTNAHNNQDSDLKGVADVTVTINNGRLRCSFTRQAWLDENDDTYYDLRENNTYYIIMAKNDELNGDGTIVYHESSNRVFSEKLISFTGFNGSSGGVEEGLKLQQSHGALMVISWVGFASIGIIMARYFKPMWPNTKLCGVGIWFVIHRTFMILSSLCTMSAFVIIFIHVRGYIQPSQGLGAFLHAVFGTVVTACVVINPIMALFRPHPGEPRRPIFNWAHWAVGTGGHTLAMITVILGLNEGGFESLIDGLPSSVFWVMIAFIIFHYVMWLLFEVQRCMTESQGRSNDIPLQGHDKGASQQQLAQNDNYTPPPEDDAYREDRACQTTKEGSMAKTALLIIYVCGVLFTVAFIVISIAMVGT